MKKPELKDFENPATGDKRISHNYKAFTKSQSQYIAVLEGGISGKKLTIPKEQLPIQCPKCVKAKELAVLAQEYISKAYNNLRDIAF